MINFLEFYKTSQSITSVVFLVFRELCQIELFAGDVFVEAQHIFGLVLEMRSLVEAVRNEQPITLFVGLDKPLRNSDKLFLDFSDQFERNFEFFLWFRSLNNSRDNCDVAVLFADSMYTRNHHDVDVYALNY